jgi:protease I
MASLKGKKVLMFVEDIYEDLELWYPKLRLGEEGILVTVAGPQAAKIYLGKNGYPCKADFALKDIDGKDFDGLVLPGGFAPDKLRRLPEVLKLTRHFMEKKKLVAHICHAGWIPISAGIVRGFRCTSTPGIKDDLINAGAQWINKAVVVDRNMISSRRPPDLPDFCKAIITFLKEH